MDSSTGQFLTSFTFLTNWDFSAASTIEVNVTNLACRCFNLPHAGESPFNISVVETEEIVAAALEENTVIEKPLKAKVFKPTYRTLLQIINKCFIGMLGSPDQVSQPQKQLLAALMQPGPYDWETAYLTTILQELKVVKTLKGVKILRQGGRITAMILKVTEGRTVYCSQVVPVSNFNWLFKGDPVAVPSVFVPRRVAETTKERLPPSSESQPMKKRRTTQTKPSSDHISIPLPTTTSINLPRSNLAP